MTEDMTREKAFEILQLDPATPTEKIKQKYENFMRRAKFDESLDAKLITKAYDTIMGINWGNFEADPAYSEKGLNKKKIENFFYHNKRGLVYSIAVFVLIAATILMIVTGKVRYDYKISVLGQVALSDQEKIAEYYEELLGKKNVLIDYYIVANSADASMDEGFMYKLMGDLQGGESDLFIVVPEYAKFLSYDGALTDLTPYLTDWGVLSDDTNLLYWYEENGGEMVAAYRFGNTSIFNQGMNGLVPEYFAIPHHAEYSEETRIVIMDLIKQNK